MTKILLSTVMRPFGITSDDCTERTHAELFHGQISFAQGLFSLRGVYGGFGLEYIALNIRPETVVLNYPSAGEFVHELKKGYDYVGISYVMSTHAKMVKMVKLIRENAPNSKIILGGYGTTIPGADELADHVCREEGIDFMRRLLGEDLNAPREHPVIPEAKKILGWPIDKGSVILAGLGCPNGCDFCNTSHFFNRKHIPILKTGQDIWNVIQKIDSKLDTRLFGIMEEDFLLYEDRARELAEITRKEVKKPVRLIAFSSLKSIKRYDPVFLAEMGIETLWIGVESRSSAELRKNNQDVQKEIEGCPVDISSYHKMDNVDIKKTIDSLHNVGINTLISMIVGLEHHTEELIKSDLDYHLSLNPSLSQFLIYTPIPGTPLYDCLNNEGRILHDIPWYQVDGYKLNFKHPHLTGEQLSALQMDCYDQEFELLGPSVFRFIDKNIKGYLKFNDSEIPIQQARAKIYKKYCKDVFPLIDIGIKYAPNDRVVGKIRNLKQQLIELFGKPSITKKIMGFGAKLSARLNQKFIDDGTWELKTQPKLRRVVYGKGTNPEMEAYYMNK